MSLIPSVFPVPINKVLTLSSTAETILWTPAAGKKWVLTDISLSATATTIITMRDGTGGTIVLGTRLTSAISFNQNLVTPIMSAAVDRVLTIKASAITAYVTITGYEVDE